MFDVLRVKIKLEKKENSWKWPRYEKIPHDDVFLEVYKNSSKYFLRISKDICQNCHHYH